MNETHLPPVKFWNYKHAVIPNVHTLTPFETGASLELIVYSRLSVQRVCITTLSISFFVYINTPTS